MLIDFEYIKQKYNPNINGIIHIGAHYGEEVSSYIKNGVNNIILFEPLYENFQILSERMKEYFANIKMYNIALGSHKQLAEMYVSDNEKQSSSILKPKVHLTHHPNVKFVSSEKVQVETLDSYNFSDFNFISMDVQGYELEVLKGAKETLKHIDFVYCEVNRDEIYEGNAYIEELDDFLNQYNMQRVETDWGGELWGDAFYIRRYNTPKNCQINELDKIFYKYFGYPSSGTFVEVGAFDGESFSNTSCLADHGWRGIYIEPVFEYSYNCSQRHKDNNVSIVNCSIGTEEKNIDLYVDTGGGLTTSSINQLNILSKIEWSKNQTFLKTNCKQYRLENIFKFFNISPNFDILVVDVEGNEEDVFNSFDLNFWHPKMLIVELVDNHKDFQIHKDCIDSCIRVRDKIINSNYIEIYSDEINSIFISKNFFNQ